MNKKEIIEHLEKRKKQWIKAHNSNHWTDYRMKNWNNPVDGIDYALKLLKEN